MSQNYVDGEEKEHEEKSDVVGVLPTNQNALKKSQMVTNNEKELIKMMQKQTKLCKKVLNQPIWMKIEQPVMMIGEKNKKRKIFSQQIQQRPP